MNIKTFVKNMDVTTDEFFELYNLVNEKYWSFKDPDDHQLAAKTLRLISDKGDPDHLILLVKMFEQIIAMEQKGGSVQAEVGFKDKSYFFKISDTADGADKLGKMLMNTVVVKTGNPQ